MKRIVWMGLGRTLTARFVLYWNFDLKVLLASHIFVERTVWFSDIFQWSSLVQQPGHSFQRNFKNFKTRRSTSGSDGRWRNTSRTTNCNLSSRTRKKRPSSLEIFSVSQRWWPLEFAILRRFQFNHLRYRTNSGVLPNGVGTHERFKTHGWTER